VAVAEVVREAEVVWEAEAKWESESESARVPGSEGLDLLELVLAQLAPVRAQAVGSGASTEPRPLPRRAEMARCSRRMH
jgi:hypothetical protein